MKPTALQDTLKWYDKNAAQYAKSIQSLDFSDQMDDMIAFLPINNKKVLDAGCAAGRDCKLLAAKDVVVTGLDLSPELIQVATRELPHITFIVGSFFQLPFDDNTFGGIWSHASLLHCETVEDVQRALRELYRVLVKGGVLHLYLKMNTQNKKFDVVTDSISYHDRFFQYFTNDELKKLLLKSGFKILKMTNEEDRAGRTEVKWNLSLSRK